jgi:phospholipid transport system substrate-binding protein
MTAALWGIGGVQAQVDEAADAMIKRVAGDVMEAVKAAPADVGDARKLMHVVDDKIMPNVNFGRMTAAVVGRAWRQATPQQQERMQAEFKTLLVRTYAGALSQLKDQTIVVKPLRTGAGDSNVVVRTLVKGGGEPLAIDYRLEKADAGWKIVDLNLMGIWLVETYRGQFAAEINARGLDGLIASLSERNRLVAKAH